MSFAPMEAGIEAQPAYISILFGVRLNLNLACAKVRVCNGMITVKVILWRALETYMCGSRYEVWGQWLVRLWLCALDFIAVVTVPKLQMAL